MSAMQIRTCLLNMLAFRSIKSILIPYYDYLVKQGPKVKRTYSKSSGKLILKNGDEHTDSLCRKTYILFKMGLKKTFSVAPIKGKIL